MVATNAGQGNGRSARRGSGNGARRFGFEPIHGKRIKAYGTKFAASEAAFDPFEQAGRARFLCKCLLNDGIGVEYTVYGTIAATGALPARSDS